VRAVISPPAQSVLDELNEIVKLDGAELHVDGSTGSLIELTLDLSNSTCPECVLPKDLLVELLTARLAEADPDIAGVRLNDPRESADSPPSHH
jgi:hypothetical protein